MNLWNDLVDTYILFEINKYKWQFKVKYRIIKYIYIYVLLYIN